MSTSQEKAEKDLTLAYMTGYHKRDDEVDALKERVRELEKRYCDYCRFLSVTEEEQEYSERPRLPHMCTKLNVILKHGFDHPRLPTPSECPIVPPPPAPTPATNGKDEK